MTLTLTLALSMSLSACGRAEKGRLEAAKSLFDKRDLAAATIELKNVLQARPEQAEARFLLGHALLLGGDALGAEVELRRALGAGHPADEVLPVLATALVALQRFAPLIREFGDAEPGPPGATAELKTQLAIAHMAQGELTRAEALLGTALQRAPEHRTALEVQARLRAARGDTAAALVTVDGLLAKKADDAPAWSLRGDILLHAGAQSQAQATEAYRRSLAADGTLLQAHTGLIALHLAAGDAEAARAQWQQLQAMRPGHPQTRFYEAVLGLQRGDFLKTREIAQQLIRNAPDNPRLQMLAGQAELAAGAWAQAESYLNKAVLLAPGTPQPRRVLAQAYLTVGQPRRALEQLAPLIGMRSRDAEAITLAGRAHLMAGDTASAETAFARVAEMNPKTAGLQTGLALARLGQAQGTGQFEAGLAALENAAGADRATDGDLALVNARLRSKQYPAALTAIDNLARKTPGSPLPDLLRGRIALAKGQRDAARTHWEAALKTSPQYLPALAALNELDLARSQPEAAHARMAAAARREPGNAALLLARADLAGRTGAGKAQVVDLLRQAVRASPNDPEARVRLVDYALALSDAGLAMTEAQAAASALPEHPAVLDRLGLAQQRSGDLQQAATTFGKLAGVQPRLAASYLRLVDVNLALGRHEAAAQQARRALELEPDNLLAHRAAAFAALRNERPTDALTLARTAQKRWPAAGAQLEAELQMAARNAEGAIAALRTALAAAPAHGEVAIQLHLALLSSGRAAEAEAHAQAWLARRGHDGAFLLHLGNLAASQGDWARAEARFQQVLAREPQQVQALNNLAHALAAQNKPEGVKLAQRALALAPGQPPLMDTLAFAQAAAGQVTEALALQKAVVEMSPDEPEYRLSLARLQIRAGDKAAARETLGLLARRGAAWPRQGEVTRLLAQAQ
ncbi:MAG: PEP-CTERM system TPR-repeat protein PrsT [Rubrivivax sp.]|nr:PEP-CTERM system TPR-repeat protein PrsT [Rubrivivax sp.]